MAQSFIFDRRTGVERRGRGASLRFPEKRSGFDRRAVDSSRYLRFLVGYRSREGLVAACLAGVVLLNAADLVLTLHLVASGAAELNPIMDAMLRFGVVPAALFKALLTVLVVAAVWMLRRYRRVLEFSLVLAAALMVLVAYQSVGLVVLPG